MFLSSDEESGFSKTGEPSQIKGWKSSAIIKHVDLSRLYSPFGNIQRFSTQISDGAGGDFGYLLPLDSAKIKT